MVLFFMIVSPQTDLAAVPMIRRLFAFERMRFGTWFSGQELMRLTGHEGLRINPFEAVLILGLPVAAAVATGWRSISLLRRIHTTGSG
jgi:hypothetical protein